jgi:uncharacterized protein
VTDPLPSPLETFEYRSLGEPVEMRDTRSHSRRIAGYAAKFDRLSSDMGFFEVVDRQFFDRSRDGGWRHVVARYNHEPNMLLATTHSGTLHLDVNPVGLWYEIALPETPTGTEVLELVRRGDVYSSSFAFLQRTIVDRWSTHPLRNGATYPLRRLLSGDVVDIAPLGVRPAYPDASVAMASGV